MDFNFYLNYILSNNNNNNNLKLYGGNNEELNNDEVIIPKSIYTEASRMTLYTIPKGSILYHGSKNKESFNPFNIKLGDDTLVGYFTSNKDFSADYISRCAFYPKESGYIHKFKTKKDIERILIISSYDKKSSWDVKNIENLFCSNNNQYGEKLDGIGFFYPIISNNAYSNDDKFDDDNLNNNNNTNQYDIEVALCDPNYFLEYISTQRCVAVRKISSNYHFTQL